jgi:NTP pyrophosphatase (non-canonical NTP hydrolase)
MTEMAALQQSISEVRAQRGFFTDPVKIMVHLTEEIGEVASQVRRTWSVNPDDFEQGQLEDEIADVFVLLTALANQFDIDIEKAVVKKFFQKNSDRTWGA